MSSNEEVDCANNSDRSVVNECAAEVNRVAVKLPAFISDDPEMWLQLVDRSFKLAQVKSEETKFDYVVTTLDKQTLAEVRDILMNPPQNMPYSTLKAALISRLSTSQEQKTRRLLEREEMGDSKPSQFLRRLRALAGTCVSESLLRTLWMGRLPSSIQGILATQKSTALDEVAELADAIMESRTPNHAVMETTTPKKVEDDRMDRLEKQILAITHGVTKLLTAADRRQSRRCERSRSRTRSRSRSRTQSRDRDGSSSDQCWYHRRFGEKARECREPCSYRAGNDAGSR